MEQPIEKSGDKNNASSQQDMIFRNLGKALFISEKVDDKNQILPAYEQEKSLKMLSVESDDALRKGDTTSLLDHNREYTNLLIAYVEDFKNNSETKLKNKKTLFVITMILFAGISLFCLLLIAASLICLAFGWITAWELVPEVIAALISLLGTFMAIPKIITKYLYNKNEDQNLATLISKIQKYDRDIRGHL